MLSARVVLGIFATEEVYLTNRRDVRPLAVTSYERDSYYSQAELDSTRPASTVMGSESSLICRPGPRVWILICIQDGDGILQNVVWLTYGATRLNDGQNGAATATADSDGLRWL